jgi:hypothetical protein
MPSRVLLTEPPQCWRISHHWPQHPTQAHTPSHLLRTPYTSRSPTEHCISVCMSFSAHASPPPTHTHTPTAVHSSSLGGAHSTGCAQWTHSSWN